METKGKPNKILEKILDELECLLQDFGCSGDTGDDHLNACHEIQHRLIIIFIQTLLSAEIKSVKEGEEEKGYKLACMAKRLTELEEAFDNKLSGLVNETGSVSSMADSVHEECLDDESVKEEEVVGERDVVDRIKRKRFRGLVSFGLVGLVAGMVSFYGYICNQMNEDTIVFIPT